jgi:hypothetical protein
MNRPLVEAIIYPFPGNSSSIRIIVALLAALWLNLQMKWPLGFVISLVKKAEGY